MKLKFIHINTYSRPIHVNPHVHNVYELVYYQNAQGYSNYGKSSAYNIESGQYLAYKKEIDEENTYYFDDNSYILYPPGTVHDEHHQLPCKLVAIGFDAEDFPVETVPLQCKDFNLSVFRLIEKISEEYRDKNFLYNKSIEASLVELLVQIYRSGNHNPQSAPDPIKYAYIYINEYFATEIDLEELAFSTGYSSSRFRELFKEQNGVSPKNYILDKRTEYAKQLLSATKLPIHEIAFLCGFSDYPQFNKFFKSRTAVNPKDYREKFRAGSHKSE